MRRLLILLLAATVIASGCIDIMEDRSGTEDRSETTVEETESSDSQGFEAVRSRDGEWNQEQLEYVEHIQPEAGSTVSFTDESQSVTFEHEIDLEALHDEFGMDHYRIGAMVIDRHYDEFQVIGQTRVDAEYASGTETLQWQPHVHDIREEIGDHEDLVFRTAIAYGDSSDPEFLDFHATTFRLEESS